MTENSNNGNIQPTDALRKYTPEEIKELTEIVTECKNMHPQDRTLQRSCFIDKCQQKNFLSTKI
ncbi:MAG: hypothetical protein QM398_08945 [Thermoproteota archaeon]|nr:hypothetical protein [Thermoproteota archaeon]